MSNLILDQLKTGDCFIFNSLPNAPAMKISVLGQFGFVYLENGEYCKMIEIDAKAEVTKVRVWDVLNGNVIFKKWE